MVKERLTGLIVAPQGAAAPAGARRRPRLEGDAHAR
jgi:hypothetical protein